MDPHDLTTEQLHQELSAARKKLAEMEQEQCLRQLQEAAHQNQQTILTDDLENLHSLINSSEDLIWHVDCEKRLLLVNHASSSVFQATGGKNVMPGMASSDYLPPKEAQYFDQIYDAALNGKTLHLNYTAYNDNEYAATVQPVKKASGVTGVSIFAKNITRVHQLEEKLRDYAQIFSTTPDLIAMIDSSYRFKVMNNAWMQAFNMAADDTPGAHLSQAVGEKYFNSISNPHLEIAFSGQMTHFSSWYTLPSLGRRFMSVTLLPLRFENLVPQYVVINARDITERRRAMDERQRIFDVSVDMFAVISFDGRFTDTNPAWQKTLGWSSEELLGTPWLNLVTAVDREVSFAINQKLLNGESVTGFENRCLCRDGSFRWLAWSAYPDAEHELIYTVVRDITERRRMDDELRTLATTDPLTGASNRRHFIAEAQTELKRCKRYASPMAVLMLDVDHFKKINDLYGHSAGDEALRQLVSCCQQELRSNDIFGRLGGEEFGAVLVACSHDIAMQICQRLKEKINNLEIYSGREQINITASIGLTMYTTTDNAFDSLLKRADDALYKAKQTGRNKIVTL